MDPNQSPTPPSGDFNQQQYDFITSPQKSAKKPLFGGGNTQRIAIFAIIGIGALTVIILLFGIITGGGGTDKNSLRKVAQTQNMIVALGMNALDTSKTTNIRTIASSAQATSSSDQQVLLAAAAKSGNELSEKEIAGKLDTETKTKLENAVQNGQYDTVFESTYKDLLAQYQSELQTAHGSTNSKSLQEALSSSYDNAVVLLEFVEQ